MRADHAQGKSELRNQEIAKYIKPFGVRVSLDIVSWSCAVLGGGCLIGANFVRDPQLRPFGLTGIWFAGVLFSTAITAYIALRTLPETPKPFASAAKPEAKLTVLVGPKHVPAVVLPFEGRQDLEAKRRDAFPAVMAANGLVGRVVRKNTKSATLSMSIRNDGQEPLTNLILRVSGDYVPTITDAEKPLDPQLVHVGWQVTPFSQTLPRLDSFQDIDFEVHAKTSVVTDLEMTPVTIFIEATADHVKPFLAATVVMYIRGPYPGSGEIELSGAPSTYPLYIEAAGKEKSCASSRRRQRGKRGEAIYTTAFGTGGCDEQT